MAGPERPRGLGHPAPAVRDRRLARATGPDRRRRALLPSVQGAGPGVPGFRRRDHGSDRAHGEKAPHRPDSAPFRPPETLPETQGPLSPEVVSGRRYRPPLGNFWARRCDPIHFRLQNSKKLLAGVESANYPREPALLLAIAAAAAAWAMLFFAFGFVLGRVTPRMPDWERRRKEFRLIRGENPRRREP